MVTVKVKMKVIGKVRVKVRVRVGDMAFRCPHNNITDVQAKYTPVDSHLLRKPADSQLAPAAYCVLVQHEVRGLTRQAAQASCASGVTCRAHEH